MFNDYSYIFLFLVFYLFLTNEGGVQKASHIIQYEWVLDVTNQEGNEQKQIGGRKGTKIVSFDHTYFLNGSLVGLTIVFVEDGDCNGDCNGLE